jgi:hypothetical protein
MAYPGSFGGYPGSASSFGGGGYPGSTSFGGYPGSSGFGGMSGGMSGGSCGPCGGSAQQYPSAFRSFGALPSASSYPMGFSSGSSFQPARQPLQYSRYLTPGAGYQSGYQSRLPSYSAPYASQAPFFPPRFSAPSMSVARPFAPSPFLPSASYTAPANSYFPPVSSFVPNASPYGASQFRTSGAFPTPSFAAFSPANFSASPAPFFGAQSGFPSAAGSYGAPSPFVFQARSYGNYAPFTPNQPMGGASFGNFGGNFGNNFGGNFGGFNTFGGFPSYGAFGASGGYGGLEQPFAGPMLALPAPPGYSGASPQFGGFPAPPLPRVPTTFESTFTGSPPPPGTFDPNFASQAPPGSYEMQPSASMAPFVGSNVPTFPTEPVTEFGADVSIQPPMPPVPEGDVVEEILAEPLEPAPKLPWAPAEGEEEFDLEYSRQVASRHLVGEESA